MTADSILDIRGLSVVYDSAAGPAAALRDIHLALPRGKITGLVGESGCGKSTLIAAILGLLAPNARVAAGEILFAGRDLRNCGEREMRALRGTAVTTVFQDPMGALNPVLSVGRQMTDIQYRDKKSRAEKRAQAAQMLRAVGIADAEARLDMFAHQFSGGMRQRIAIAMAMLPQPRLLIADEPTTALDATLEVQILRLLREMQERFGTTVLFVSHHLGAVAELCDEVAVLYAGEIAERGAVRDIFCRAAHPYTQKLLECDPGRIERPTARLPTIAGRMPDLRRRPDGCIFAPRCERAFSPCRECPPPQAQIAAGHFARCHLYGDGKTP